MTGTTKASGLTSLAPKDPGSQPRAPAPDGPGPSDPVHPRSSKSSLGFISSPLIWPGRKRPGRGSPPSTARVPTKQVDTVTKPTAKADHTPAPNKHGGVLSEAPKPTEDWSVSGQGSQEAVPPSLSEVSNRKSKPTQPEWFLGNQTGADEDSPLPEQSKFHASVSTAVPPGYTGTIGSRLLALSPSRDLPQNLVTLVETFLSSGLQRDFEETGNAAASLPVSVTGELLSSAVWTRNLLPLAGVTAATASAGDAPRLRSDIPEVFPADGTSTLTSDLPGRGPPFMSAGFYTGDPRPPTGDPRPPTGDPRPPTGDPWPPSGVYQSEAALPDPLVQTHPPPLFPSPSFSLHLSSPPPLSSFHTSSAPLSGDHMTLAAATAMSFPELTPGPGLGFRLPAPGSGFPSSLPTHEAFVFKLLPPADAEPDSPAAPVESAGGGVGGATAPASGPGTAKQAPKCPCKQRSGCPCWPSPGNST